MCRTLSGEKNLCSRDLEVNIVPALITYANKLASGNIFSVHNTTFLGLACPYDSTVILNDGKVWEQTAAGVRSLASLGLKTWELDV